MATPVKLTQLFSALVPWCSSGQVLMLFQKHCLLLCFPLFKYCLLKSSKTAIDPSQFLRFLKEVLVKSGRLHFWPAGCWGNFGLYFGWTLWWFHSCLELGATQDLGVLPPEYWQWRFFYHLSASSSKHSTVFFRFIFNARTSFRRQFFFL